MITEDRLLHGLAALPLVAFYAYAYRRKLGPSGHFAVIAFALLGSWVPDWDLILGIGFHRSPLTHSALPAIAVSYVALKRELRNVVAGFALGIASHLFLDTVDYGNVIGIPGGNADRMYLSVNGLILLGVAFVMAKKIPDRNCVPTIIKSKRLKKADNETNRNRIRSQDDVHEMANRASQGASRNDVSGPKMNSETMTTKITILGCAILLICYFLAAAMAKADDVDDLNEIAATCAAYTADAAASSGIFEYVGEAIWWSNRLEGLFDGDQQRADTEISLVKEQMERTPDVEDDDFFEAHKARTARLLRVAKLCTVTRKIAQMAD